MFGLGNQGTIYTEHLAVHEFQIPIMKLSKYIHMISLTLILSSKHQLTQLPR